MALSPALSYVCLVGSAILWGVNYLPVKHYETGDGLFFQFVNAFAIVTSGLVVHWVQGFPALNLYAVYGGLMWTTGNVVTVLIIKLIGIGIGAVLWAIIGLVIAWAVARFGWFGIKAQVPRDPVLNYVGVAFAVLSIITFLFVKTNAEQLHRRIAPSGLHAEHNYLISESDKAEAAPSRLERRIMRMNAAAKKLLGCSFSVLAGCMYGFTYAPIIFVQNNVSGASQDFNDYFFAYTIGIFAASLFYFFLYCIYEKNQPKICSESILPGIIIGWIWAIANLLYNLSANSITQTIVVPISNCGPSSIVLVMSFFYKEISGFKNILFLVLGFSMVIVSSVLCSLSNTDF